jgi:hypothetical protein
LLPTTSKGSSVAIDERRCPVAGGPIRWARRLVINEILLRPAGQL